MFVWFFCCCVHSCFFDRQDSLYFAFNQSRIPQFALIYWKIWNWMFCQFSMYIKQRDLNRDLRATHYFHWSFLVSPSHIESISFSLPSFFVHRQLDLRAFNRWRDLWTLAVLCYHRHRVPDKVQHNSSDRTSILHQRWWSHLHILLLKDSPTGEWRGNTWRCHKLGLLQCQILTIQLFWLKEFMLIILTAYLKAFGCMRVSCPSKAKVKTHLQTFPIYQLM